MDLQLPHLRRGELQAREDLLAGFRRGRHRFQRRPPFLAFVFVLVVSNPRADLLRLVRVAFNPTGRSRPTLLPGRARTSSERDSSPDASFDQEEERQARA